MQQRERWALIAEGVGLSVGPVWKVLESLGQQMVCLDWPEEDKLREGMPQGN